MEAKHPTRRAGSVGSMRPLWRTGLMGAQHPRAQRPKYVADEERIFAGAAAHIAAERSRIHGSIRPATEKAMSEAASEAE